MDFHWNGDQLTEEIPVGADGTAYHENSIRWIYEPGSFTPLARYEKGQLCYAVTDTVGRIQELVTEDGTIVWRGKQQLWGREEGLNKDIAPSCRLRFPGQYEDAESGLYYNRFRYYDCETGQYLCADPIGLRGGLNSYAYVPNPLKYIDPLGLCKDDIISKASQWQGKGDYPGVDNWQLGTLKKGDIIYGGVPGQTEFYLSQSTLDAAEGSMSSLWRSAQVKPHDVFGYRPQVQGYEVLKDTDVATSVVNANPHLGEGGAIQYFVDDYQSVLRPTGEPIVLK